MEAGPKEEKKDILEFYNCFLVWEGGLEFFQISYPMKNVIVYGDMTEF